jgi:hypothetical protein
MAITMYNVATLKLELSKRLNTEVTQLLFAPEMNNILGPDGVTPIPESIAPKVFTGFYRFWAISPDVRPFEIKCPARVYDALLKDKEAKVMTVDNLVITTFEARTSKKGTEYDHVFIDLQVFSAAF